MATNQKKHSGNESKSNHGHSNSNNHSSNRGFAAMDDEKQREIASKGGKASHSGNHSGKH